MRPLSAPTAGLPHSSPLVASPLLLTSHSRGDFPCQPPTTARATAETCQITSRARASAPSRSLPANESWPRKTITPTGGSSASAAVFVKASSTADSSESSSLTIRRFGEPKQAVKSSASAAASASSCNTNQLPAGAELNSDADGVDASTQTVSKTFWLNGSGTVRRWMRRRKMPVISAVTVPA